MRLNDAAKYFAISRSTLYRLRDKKHVRMIKRGSRTLVDVPMIVDYYKNLAESYGFVLKMEDNHG
jgi:hypothetical protein